MYHNIIYKEAVKKIESGVESKVIEGINALRESGKPDTVSIIVNVLNTYKEEAVSAECAKFFNDIKDQKAVVLMVDEIKKSKDQKSLQILVSAAWQNNLDYSDFLEVFADVVLKHDYLVAYEAFTVIENNIDKISRERADLIQEKIAKGLTSIKDEKQSMVSELLHIINDLKKD